jgi:hypothetical protein
MSQRVAELVTRVGIGVPGHAPLEVAFRGGVFLYTQRLSTMRSARLSACSTVQCVVNGPRDGKRE